VSKVFISHSSKDKHRLEDFRDLLEKEGVPFWVDDQGILVGDDAPKELRDAIQDCICCIFFVTENSLKSEWCIIETAAFWGAGKEVLSYYADLNLTRQMLPGHLQSTVPSNSSKSVREKAARLVQEAGRMEQQMPADSAAGVPIEVLEAAIRRAVGLAQVQRALYERLLIVRALSSIDADGRPDDDSITAVLPSHMHAIRGFSRRELDEGCRAQWPARFALVDDTGARVEGYCARMNVHGDSTRFESCLVLFFIDEYCDGSGLVRSIEARKDNFFSISYAKCFGNFDSGRRYQLVEMNGDPWTEPPRPKIGGESV